MKHTISSTRFLYPFDAGFHKMEHCSLSNIANSAHILEVDQSEPHSRGGECKTQLEPPLPEL